MAHIAKYQKSAVGRMCEHYARVPELERGYDRDNIDRSRTGLNYNLCTEHDGGQVKFINDRIASLNLKRKPRKDAVTMCDLVLTAPQSLDQAREREFFASAYGFLAGKFGRDNIISAWVHMDETTPHMHFAWVPVTDDGRLAAKDVVNRPMLKALHGEMQRAIEADMGTHVEVILDPEKAADKALSDLGHAQYRAAKQEIEQTEKRLEGVQQEVDAAAARTGELEREVEAARARVRDLENERDGLAGAARRLAAEIGHLIALVQERVGAASRAIREMLGRPDARDGECRAEWERRYDGELDAARDVMRAVNRGNDDPIAAALEAHGAHEFRRGRSGGEWQR